MESDLNEDNWQQFGQKKVVGEMTGFLGIAIYFFKCFLLKSFVRRIAIYSSFVLKTPTRSNGR